MPGKHWMHCERITGKRSVVNRRSWRDRGRYRWLRNWKLWGRRNMLVEMKEDSYYIFFCSISFIVPVSILYFLKNTFYMSWMIYLGIPGNAETAGSTAITRTGERNANEVWTTKASNTNEADAGLRISWKCESFAKVYSNHTFKTIMHLVYASQELSHVAIAYRLYLNSRLMVKCHQCKACQGKLSALSILWMVHQFIRCIKVPMLPPWG